ncbi:N-acetylmuramoyl-L-alanine amidase CwlD [Paenibacillus protaetiae]|nr:N-acetylmuramoyl-L-alanine amidase CwlD [Paenibacillus protaetiae]
MTYKGAMRIALGLIAVTLTFMLLGHNMPSVHTWTYWSMPLSGKTVVIDAGHGGIDGGAVSKSGAIEKDLNLAIALYLRDYLQQSGASVLMTREGDYDLAGQDTNVVRKRKTEDLLKRVSVIQNSGAKLAVSIHMNSIPSDKWSGAQTFYYPNGTDNGMLATFIQNEIRRNLENTSRVPAVKQDVYVLKAVKDIPTVLVEVGFLSNPGESQRLVDPAYQKQIAAAIYQGILRYASGEKINVSSSG